MSVIHSKETKLQAIRLYHCGYGSIAIRRKLGVNESTILHWVRCYELKGISVLTKQPYSKLSASEKTAILEQIDKKCLSCQSAALRYSVGRSSLYRWQQSVKEGGGYGRFFRFKWRANTRRDMGRPKKQPPQTELEQLRERVAYLEAENALLKKVKALVEEEDARLRKLGQKPSKN